MQKIKVLLAFCILFFRLSIPANAQSSERLRISLITCTPGQELYSIFGHSALRIIDSNSVSDFIVNYGTFDFNDDGFYVKFMRGKLKYFVSVQSTSDFMYDYEQEGRGITEQILHLTEEEKSALKNALIENLKPENRFYQYDFFFDNCTTRLRDLLVKYKNPHPSLPAVMDENTRFRKAIHDYLDQGGQEWSKLGIDILLGARTDRIMSAKDQEFLPDNLMMALEKADVKMVASSRLLLPRQFNGDGNGKKSPEFYFTAVLFIFFILGISKNKYAKACSRISDHVLFFTTGLLGLLLVFMWIGTDHSMTKDNFNLAWALPSFILMPWMMNRKNNVSSSFFRIHLYILGTVLICWNLLPQALNPALMPFVLLLFIRILAQSKK